MRADLQNPTTPKQQKDREAYEGLVGNHAGSEAERIVFEKLNNMVRTQPADAILVLYNYEVNLPKIQALSVDVPATTKYLHCFLTRTSPNLQVDFLILVRNVGVILIEVKRTDNPQSMEKATKQLGRAGRFFNIIAIATKCFDMPIVKMVIYSESSAQPTTTVIDVHHVRQDVLANLEAYLLATIMDMKANLPQNSFQPHAFKIFSQLSGGLFFLQPMGGFLSLLERDMLPLSESTIVKKVDEDVDHAHLSSNVRKRSEY